ncbi:hypothetical protein CES85_4407 [Ochrobactrum quorumnocens]|uniref:Uncharacterized protein n=1 Tax=Ochrobactrum quorumnocens TaxID=271865 RepID=A0A248UA61_9HYPH|nr:hypothetical protein CES85_4407 [[Ochrobactrum] quorumnocens]
MDFLQSTMRQIKNLKLQSVLRGSPLLLLRPKITNLIIPDDPA